MLDVNMTDKMTGHETAGYEIAGHETTGHKEHDMKLAQMRQTFEAE